MARDDVSEPLAMTAARLAEIRAREAVVADTTNWLNQVVAATQVPSEMLGKPEDVNKAAAESLQMQYDRLLARIRARWSWPLRKAK